MPEKIGQYTVVSQIGRGGMGIVYKGRDESLNRFVAIKVLSEQLAEDGTLVQRFEREAQAAAGLSHPNIVQIYFIGEDNGHPYFVMEYVPGRSLDQLLRAEGRVDNPRAAQIILQAAHGLAAAHDKGIIHRDIKPANLILDDRGLVKIADFGLALPADAQTQLTATGMFVGTPGYLAPEQCAGEKADNRTDIYALGVSFYMLLTGTPPFRGDSPLALVKQIMDAEPADVSTLNPTVDEETRRILKRMIAKDRAQRYQNCHELVADLEEYLAKSGVRSMTAGLAARTPSATPELAAAAAAPTQAIGSRVTKPDAQAVPTIIQSKTEPPTHPEPPAAAPVTVPDFAAQPQPSSSRAAIVVIVIAFVLLVGGGIAAAVFGTRVFRSFQARWQQKSDTPVTASQQPESQTASAAAPTTTTAPEGVLLSEPVKVPVATTASSDPGSAPTEPAPNKTEAAMTGGSAPAVTPAAAPARRASPAPRQNTAAENQQPPAENRRRSRSGVAVAVTGDQALIGAVSNVLRSELESAGLEVVDANTLPATEDLLRGGGGSSAHLIDLIGREGYAVLVIARVDPAGQRELHYYGRYDTLYTARVTVTAYDLATGRPLGSSRSANVDYTSINADSKSEEVVGPIAKAVADAIRSH